jgi:hypothetical protein
MTTNRLKNRTVHTFGEGKKSGFSLLTLWLSRASIASVRASFFNKSGNKLDPRDLHKIFKETLAKAGYRQSDFHCLI